MGLVIEDKHRHTVACKRTRKVRISGCVIARLAEEASGKHVRVEWGSPDDEGFYTPTVITTEEPL